jgi:hypothetical protein
MDETVEEDVVEEIKEQIIEEPIKEQIQENIREPMQNGGMNSPTNNSSHLSFNDIDYVRGDDGSVSNVMAPKSIERLEEISEIRAKQRREDEEDDGNNVKLQISDQSFHLDSLDIHNIEEPKIDLLPDLLIDDVEVLDDL